MIDDDRALLLDEERTRTMRQIADLQRSLDEIIESSESVALDDEHDPEGSTIAFERAKAAALLAQARSQLVLLDEADRRLHAGTFGVCERCGNDIPTERLRAVPLAKVCVNC